MIRRPSEPRPGGPRTLWVADLGLHPYADAWRLQKALVEARLRGHVPDLLLFTEHEPVFTLGRAGARQNLLVTDSFLQERGIPCLTTERGGDVTCHVPGQLVGYPVMRIPGGDRRVRAFMNTLEEAIIRTLDGFGIRGQRTSGQPGVWAGGGKIAFMGLAVKHGICFHGFALNVSPDLTPFSWMHPCGLQDTRVTSMQSLLHTPPPAIGEVMQVFTDCFCSLLGRAPCKVSPEELPPPHP